MQYADLLPALAGLLCQHLGLLVVYKPSIILRSCDALSLYNVYIEITHTKTQESDLADHPPHKVNAVAGIEDKG